MRVRVGADASSMASFDGLGRDELVGDDGEEEVDNEEGVN